MGCGASRNVVAPEVVTIEAKPTPGPPLAGEEVTTTEEVSPPLQPPSPTPSQKSTSSRISIRSRSDRPKSRTSKTSLRQKFERMKQDSDLMGDATRDDPEPDIQVPPKRETSAQSQESGATIDSGYSDDSPNMITEDSEACEQEVAGSARPQTPDLSVSGTGFMSSRVSSATTRHLQKLKVSPPKKLVRSDKSTSSPSISTSSLSPKTPQCQQPPLLFRRGASQGDIESVDDVTPRVIQRPGSRGGMAFDIQYSTPDTGNVKRTPNKLGHLDRRTRSVETLRHDIEARMRAAEERRKEKERKLLERLERQKSKESSVQSALDEFAKSQAEMSQVLETKMAAKTENREAHFKMLRGRLQAQKEKAEKVRLNKNRDPPSSIPLTAE